MDDSDNVAELKRRLSTAEAALREKQDHYRTIFEAIDEGFCVIEMLFDDADKPVDYRFVEVNSAFERQTGLSEVVGRCGSEITPGTEGYWIEMYGGMARGSEARRFENYHAATGRWYDVYASRVNGLDTPRVGIVFKDITERKRGDDALRESEERQAFSLQLTDALRPLADPIEAQDVAARMLGTKLAVDRCYYAEFDWPRDVLHISQEYTRSAAVSAIGAHPISAFKDLLQFSHKGDPLVCDAIATHPVFGSETAAYRERGTDAFILMPLVKQETMVACMCVTMEVPRQWLSAEVELVKEVAERTWSAVERARAESALRESEARYQALFAASPVPFMVLAANPPDFTIMGANKAYFAATLTTPETLIGRRLFDVFTDDPSRPGQLGSEALDISLERVLRTRQTDAMKRVRYDIRTPSGGFEEHWWLAINAPLLDAAGNVTAIIHQVDRQTELHRAEVALRESEEQQRLTLQLVPALLWWTDAAGHGISANQQWKIYTGQEDPELQDYGWLDAIHPDDREATRVAFEHAFATGEPVERQQRIHQGSNGYRWHLVRHVPVRDESSAIAHWFGAAIDVHELRETQEHQHVLVAELQHRTRNLMGVVAATFEATLRSSADLEDFSARYRRRVSALARVQALLSRLSPDERITFDRLIHDEIAAIGASERVTLAGPSGVALRSSTVQTFALALHELATNAIKYGALKQPDGHLSVTWRFEPAGPEAKPWLHVDWRESGVAMPPVDAGPQGTGQGRQLIERALPYQLGARTTYVMGPDGVQCSIAVPVSSKSASENPDGNNTPTAGPAYPGR